MQQTELKILLVENDPAHLEAVQRAIENGAPHAVVCVARTLCAFREQANASPPDIALMDLDLPDGHAIEVLTSPPEAAPFPVVVMTGHGDEEMAVEVMKAGALDYIVKSPEAIAGLPHVLERALREWNVRIEHQRAERSLAEEAVRRRVLVDQSRDGIVVLDENGKVYEANQRYAEMLGYSAEEVRHLYVWDWDTQWPREELLEMIRLVNATGDHFETQHRRKDGTLLDVEISTNGAVCGDRKLVFCVCRDITWRKQAEAALRRSEEKFSSVFRHAPALITINDMTDGRYLDINEVALEVSGFTRDEVIGKTPLELSWMSLEDLTRLVKIFRREGRVANMDVVFHSKEGKEVYCLYCGEQIFVEGSPRLLSMAQDISERKRAEEALRESEERLRVLFGAVQAGVMLQGKDGRIGHVNEVAARIFGMEPQEVLGRTSMDPRWQMIDESGTPVPGEEHPSMLTLRTGKPIRNAVRGLFANDPSATRWLLINTEPLFKGDANEVAEVLMTFLDITELKRTQDELRAERDFVESLVDTTQAIVLVLDTEGRIVRFNASMEELSGYSLAEVQGKDWFDTFLPGRDRLRIRALFQEAVKDVQIRGNINPIVTKSAQERQIEWYDRTLKDGSGRILGVLSTGQDVTERKRAEEALRESEGRFRALFETIPGAVFVHQGACFLDVNATMERITGYSRDELLDMPFWGLAHPNFQGQIKDLWEARRRGKAAPSPYEAKIVTKEGEERWVVAAASRVLLAGEPAVLGTLIDITDLKEAEAATERQHQLLTTLMEAIPDYIYVKDAESRFLLSNRAHLRQLGAATQEEAEGKKDADFFPPEMASKYRDDEQAVIASGQPLLNREEKARDPEGNEQWLLTTKIPFCDSQGRTIGIVGISRDITERKRAEEAHAALEERLRQVQRMESVGQLAGGVAHDFNNILQAMMAHVDFLMEEASPDDPGYEDLVGIRHGVDRAATLVRQLLAFSRRQILDLKEIELNSLVGDFLKMLRRVIGEDIELEFVSGRDMGFVRADPAQLEQVLMNLCVNARDAMPEGGMLTIRTRPVFLDAESCEAHPGTEPGHYALLTVADTGTGMDEKTRERIFDPFFTTKEVGKGTGLGLPTVYGIVVQHRGMVEVSSELGKGSLFSIYLPMVEQRGPAVESHSRQKPEGGTETILLAEDDASVRDMAMRVLEHAGYRVLLASNGEEAIEQFDAHAEEIDLVLSDVVMPKKGGRHVHDYIKTVKPETKVLFSSGYSADAIHTRFVLDEGMRLIQKPYSPDALLTEIREMLDS